MSQDPTAFIGFGYELGGPTAEVGGWKLKNVKVSTKYGEYGTPELDVPWFNDEDESSFDFEDSLQKALGEDCPNVMLKRCGAWDYCGYVLVHRESYTAVDWSDIADITTEVRTLVPVSAVQELVKAMKILQLVPKNPNPRWLLGCFYG